MTRPLRRLIYLVLLLLWLAVIAFPVFAVVLAVRQEIRLGDADGTHVRIFLVSESGNEGIGIESSRRLRGDGGHCLRSNVTYLMWAGEGQNSSYCRCYDAFQSLSTTGSQCPSGQ